MTLPILDTSLRALDFVYYRKKEHTFRAGGNQLFPIYYQVISGMQTFALLNKSDTVKSLLGKKIYVAIPFFLITQLSISILFSSKAIHTGVTYIKNLDPNKIEQLSQFVAEKTSPKVAQGVQKIHKLAKNLHPYTSDLKEQMEPDTRLYRFTHATHQYLPSLMQVITIAASVGLISEGKRKEGQIALGILALDCIFTHIGLLEDGAQKLRNKKWERLGNAISSVTLPMNYYLSPIKINFYWATKQSLIGHSCLDLYQGNFLKKISAGCYILFNVLMDDLASRFFSSVSNTKITRDLYIKILQSPKTVNTLHKLLNNEIVQSYLHNEISKKEIKYFLRWCHSPSKLPPQKVTTPIYYDHDLTVDKTHIQTPLELPNEPSIDLKADLTTLFDKCKLSEDVLQNKQSEDDVLKRAISEGKLGTSNGDITNYLKIGLEKFANTIIYRAPQAGEMESTKDYTDYRIMIKCCVEKWLELSKQDNVPHDVEDAIVNLGLIGHYCNAGVTDVVDSYFTTYVDMKNQSIERRVLNLLQTARQRTIDSFFDNTLFQRIGAFANVQDRHLRNMHLGVIYWLFGEPLPRSFQADKGNTVSWQEIGSKLRILQSHPQTIEILKQRHSIDFIVNTLRDDHHNKENSQITYKMYENWFSDWYARHNGVSLEKGKETFREEVLDETYHIKTEYFRVLLVELGILRNRSKDPDPLLQKTIRDFIEEAALYNTPSNSDLPQ